MPNCTWVSNPITASHAALPELVAAAITDLLSPGMRLILWKGPLAWLTQGQQAAKLN
ncbi:MAG: hypothetical protein AB8B35_07380 [Prochlorococcus sp.]